MLGASNFLKVFLSNNELLNPLNLARLFAQANDYQGKTIRIVVGNLPGNSRDLRARADKVIKQILDFRLLILDWGEDA